MFIDKVYSRLIEKTLRTVFRMGSVYFLPFSKKWNMKCYEVGFGKNYIHVCSFDLLFEFSRIDIGIASENRAKQRLCKLSDFFADPAITYNTEYTGIQR